MADTTGPGYVIMGASGSIGAEVARQLVAKQARVLLASRPSERLTALGEELEMPTRELDARNTADVEACFGEARERFERLDGGACCVGSLLLKPAHLTSDQEWEQVLACNLTAAFATVRAAAKTMRKGGGSVVLIASAAAKIGLANHEAIAAAKAGVIGLTRSAAASYASRGVRFNAVAPGLVKTKLTERIWKQEAATKASLAMHALGRLGEPAEVAALISWLLDPTNSWVTGEIFSIDGGLATVRLNR